MPCEKHQRAIIDAAASGEVLPAAVRSHLDGCAACHAAFEDERRLFAAIDTGVRNAVHYEVPASLRASVRARIADEAMPTRWNWMRTWAAAAASAVLIMGILVARNARHSVVIPSGKPTNVASSVSQPINIPASTSIQPRVAATRTGKRRGAGFSKSKNYVIAADARPLVPDGQREALNELISKLQSGEVKGDILVSKTWNGQVEDLQIAPIEIPPLSAVSADEASPEMN